MNNFFIFILLLITSLQCKGVYTSIPKHPSSLGCAFTNLKINPHGRLNEKQQPISLIKKSPSVSLNAQSSPQSTPGYDFEVAIIGCGVGGHAAALHASANKLKTAVFTAKDPGGTCVNRGCVPSKALLAATGALRQINDVEKLSSFGITTDGPAQYSRKGIAAHATNLVSKVKSGLTNSLKGHGVEMIEHTATIKSANKIEAGGKIYNVKNIIIAPGSVPIVPKGIEVDGETVFTSDHAVELKHVPKWVAIVGSGYIGLEFSDIFTALGSEVTFIEAMPKLMPTFDPDISKIAERLLIQDRPIDYRLGVFASEVKAGKIGEKPVQIRMIDSQTKKHVETINVDACMIATGRSPNTSNLGLESIGVETKKGGFIRVDEYMRVIPKENEIPLENIYCIGDANGKLMLAHAASAMGISAINDILNKKNNNPPQKPLELTTVPAACFTHPEIAFVGLTEAQAQEKAKNENFKLQKSQSHFRANSKALAENESHGLVKLLYRGDNYQLLGAHIIGPHASDLIQECANAISTKTSLKELAMMVHSHPTLSETVESAFKTAVGMLSH